MAEFLKDNLGTIIVGMILTAAVIVSAYFTLKNRKKGKCCSDCENCTEKCKKNTLDRDKTDFHVGK